jgi:aminopeptidase N
MDSTQATEALYAIWQGASSAKIDLSEVDAMAISYQLAIHMPQRAADIVAIQRSRLTSQNLIKEYDFVAPSVSASQCERDSVFESLLKVENRGVEPWVRTSLANLNHRLRRAEAVKYLKPGLEVLEEIKNTGDIFFPKSWLMSLFSGHERAAVAQAIDEFLCAHPDYLPMLRSKILFFR